MQREPVNSISISSAAYAPDVQTLEVEFLHSGAVYAYFAVPEDLYRAFLASRSKGRFFNRRIRNVYPCVKVRERQSA